MRPSSLCVAAEGKRTLTTRAPVHLSSVLSPRSRLTRNLLEEGFLGCPSLWDSQGSSRAGPGLAHPALGFGFGERMVGGLGSEGPSLEPQLLAGKPSVGSTEYSQCKAPCRPHLPAAWEPLPCDAQSKPGTGLEPQVVLGATGKEAVAPAHLLPPSTLLVLGAPRLLLPPLCPPLTCVPPERLAQRRMPAPPGRPQVPAGPLLGPGGPGGNGHVENSLWALGTCSHTRRGQPVTCLPQASFS